MNWIEKEDGNIVNIKNSKREYLKKEEITQIVKYEPEPHVVSLESTLNQNGVVQILAKDKRGNYKSHEFIKIVSHGDLIRGYTMTGNDTLTTVIPIEQIEKIQLQDKKTSSAMTAVLVFGTVLGITTIAALSAMSDGITDGWSFSK